MTPALEAAFARQAEACAGLGSPFMGRMLPLLPGVIDPESALGARLRAWPESTLGAQADSVPLRLAGGLHLLHLSGTAPALSAVYPPHDVKPRALRLTLADTCRGHAGALLAALDTPPQTNEVRRAAVLIAAGHWLTARLARPLVTSEIGASAGLNLNWDFMCLKAAGHVLGPQGAPVVLTPDWSGTPPTLCPAYVAEARGVDLRPIDVSDPDAALRLTSYLWPDQPDRLARTRAAIALFLAPDTDGVLEEGDALPWLNSRLTPRAGHCHLIYSTVAWQYLSTAAQADGEARIAAAGHDATDDAPLAWLRMEADGAGQSAGPGARLTLRLWPGDLSIDLGRADFHGRWIDWRAPPP
ncbi:MAG: DUF2332 family protein [Pseudomonadota bacterium]